MQDTNLLAGVLTALTAVGGACGTAFTALWNAHKRSVERTEARLDECEEDRKSLRTELGDVRAVAAQHESKLANLELQIESLSPNPKSTD